MKFLTTQIGSEILHVNGVPRTSMLEEEIQDFNERLLQFVRHGLSTGSISPEGLLNVLWKDDLRPIPGGKLEKVWFL